ncbi:MAG: flagellar hook protein FlgE [Rhodoferax sp.]|nr:flagellar hook protein FlgE [Rhodoferax sp.]MBP7490909.1 flagellar hook protein FlgE [Rhodoferax sp.]
MSFQTGLSGLAASSRSLDVIGNNIANANTTGMKSSRAEFSDIVASSLGASGGGGSGIGVSVATVSQAFSQGSINITGNNLDVAVNGGGFFQQTMPDGSFAYTRAGNFKLDATGNMVTNSGGKVMGYPVDSKTGLRTSSTLQAMTLPTGAPIAASATTKITAEFNLPTAATLAAGVPAVPAVPPLPAVAAIPPTPRSTYGTSLTAYDSQGTAVPASLYFEKTGDDTWDVYSSLDPAATAISTMTFDVNGQNPTFVPAAPFTIDLQSPNTNIGTAGVFTADLDLSGATQYGTGFAVSNLTQDGYTSGELTGVNIGENGNITANYSNGKSQVTGQLALVNFRNVQGLSPTGGNNWIESASSGQPVYGVPGAGKFGGLRSGALEESNVDLTAELVNMMTAQRAYQANAQTIKTQDQVMSTLVNLR